MDQHAFRQLLATPARPGQDTAGPSTASDSHRRFGATAKRKADALGSASSSLTSFAPRSVPNAKKGKPSDDGAKPRQAGPKKNSATGEAYVDRAKARREGEDEGLNEFAEVERLREEWEDKMRNAKDDEEREKLREQMAYLGGDAKHSVLVKGLDFALLEQQRARAAGLISDDGSGAEATKKPLGDDDLEALYEENKARGTSGSPNADEGPSRGKKSRDQVIEALKRRRLGLSSSIEKDQDKAQKEEAARLDELERQKKLGKFKPIGASSAQAGKAKDQEEEKPEYIWKDGKRMRKKKKQRPAEEEAKRDAAAGASSAAQQVEAKAEGRVRVEKSSRSVKAEGDKEGRQEAAQSVVQSQEKEVEERMDGEAANATSAAQAAVSDDKPASPVAVPQAESQLPAPASPSPPATAPPPPPEEDDDEDIFADAGSWKGVELDESDDEKRDAATAASDAQIRLEAERGPGGKRDWFGDGRQETDKVDDGSAQDEAKAILARIGARAREEKEEEDQDAERPMRLQGLSDSALPSEVTRAMLEKEEERERRKAEKLRERIMEQREKKRRRKAGETAPEGEEGGATGA